VGDFKKREERAISCRLIKSNQLVLISDLGKFNIIPPI